MKANKGPLMLGIMIITVGVGWLLTAKGVVPGIDWVWTLGLAVVGVLTFVLSGGLDKLSVLVGPFFLVASVLSVLRQSGRMKIDTEVPLLVILLGVLVIVAQLPMIPVPRWIEPVVEDERK